VAPLQEVVVWQVAQVVGYPADVWFGLLVVVYSVLWHE
jgi:hypothetical protein